MPVHARLTAAVPALLLALTGGVQAQSGAGTPAPNTAGSGTAAQSPSAADPGSRTPTPQAPDMPTYAGMLRQASQALRAEIARAEGDTRTTQAGASSPDIIRLMQAVETARQVAERAPTTFQGNRNYNEVTRELRQRHDAINARRPTRDGALEQARGAAQALDRLREGAGDPPG